MQASIKISRLPEIYENRVTDNDYFVINDGDLVTSKISFKTLANKLAAQILDNVSPQVQSDWDVNAFESLAFIKNKPAIGNGTITIKDSDGLGIGSFSVNQSSNSSIDLPAGFSGNYNDLTNKPTAVSIGDGILELKDPKGVVGLTFSANQATSDPKAAFVYFKDGYIQHLPELP